MTMRYFFITLLFFILPSSTLLIAMRAPLLATRLVTIQNDSNEGLAVIYATPDHGFEGPHVRRIKEEMVPAFSQKKVAVVKEQVDGSSKVEIKNKTSSHITILNTRNEDIIRCFRPQGRPQFIVVQKINK